MTPEMITQLYELIFFPLIAVLAGFVIKFIRVKTEELKSKTSNDTLNKYITMFENTVTNCVLATNQTYVDALKKQGNFDMEAQKIAFEKTKEAVMNILTEEAKEFLTVFYGDLDKQLTAQIEATVNINK